MNAQTQTKLDLELRVNELRQITETCRAWTEFLALPKIKNLVRIGLQLNESWSGDRRLETLELRFPELHDEKTLLEVLRSMFLAEAYLEPPVFKRRDIYDKMAYASFPLWWFVETTDRNAKVEFSLPLPMVFAVSSFRLKHQLTKFREDRWGRLYLHDGRVPSGRDLKRQVAERRNFPIDTPRSEMFAELLEYVKSQGDECLFTITEDTLIGAIIRDNSEAEFKLHAETT